MTIGLIVRERRRLIIGCDSRVTYGGEVEVAQKWLRSTYGIVVAAGSAGWWHRVRRAIGPAGFQSTAHAMDVIHDAVVGVCATLDPTRDSVSLLAALRTDTGLAGIYADHTGDVREVGDMEGIGRSIAARVAWPLMPDVGALTDRVRACMTHIGDHVVDVGPPYRVWSVTSDGVDELRMEGA